jgi:NAD(P)-dependent dehydrogenase (short-subunit alcohol dehydrogenase family)
MSKENNAGWVHDERNALTRWTPVVRGLLAQDTGDADIPWQPVILQAFVSPEALAYAAAPEKCNPCAVPGVAERLDRPALFVALPSSDAQSEPSRDLLAKAFEDYAASHGTKPQAVCLCGLGILRAIADRARPGQPLAGRVAVVTGAAGAIGRGICRGLLEQGARVAALDLSEAGLKELESEENADFPERVIGVTVDVTSADSVAQGFARVVSEWGGVDIIVINAGIAHVAALTELPLETFQKLERVNVDGTLLTLAEGARILQSQGTGGDVVLVSTKNVFAPGARFGAYSATKAASHQLARIASLELAEFGIRVNMVAPDGVFSDGGKTKSGLWATVGPDRMKARGLDEKGLEEYYRNRNLLKMRVTARHVANAVLFFVTRQTPTTGATIPVDGGLPDATPR